MSSAAILQRGGCVESASSPKRAAVDRCNNDRHTVRDGVRLDDERERYPVYEGQRRRGSIATCMVFISNSSLRS